MKFLSFFALVLLGQLTTSAQTPQLAGKWVAKIKTPTDTVSILYTFEVQGDKLSGLVEGPDGTAALQNGSFKDSTVSFDIEGRRTLHQAGRFYGDSIALDFTIRTGPTHIVLTRSTAKY